MKREDIVNILRTTMSINTTNANTYEAHLNNAADAIAALQANEILNNLVFTPEKLESYFKEASIWEEQVARLLKLKPESLKGLKIKFIAECKVKDARWNSLADAKSHFVNYARKQPPELIINAPNKRESKAITSEDKYNAFISHIKIHKSIPANADWVNIYEYLNKINNKEAPILWNGMSYNEKNAFAENTISIWAHGNFTITDSNKYTSEKTSGGLSKHIQQLKDSLT